MLSLALSARSLRPNPHVWAAMVCTIFSLPVSSQSVAATTALLVGGGYDIHSSQGQIELNVNWVQGVLKNQGLNVNTYFTDGNETGADVYYNLLPGQAESDYEPLARIFGDRIFENQRYRENTVAELLGSTRRNQLEPALRNIISETSNSDLLLVYNGHGSQSLNSPDEVVINLWDHTTLSARELHTLIEPQKEAFRFVFTQCYSGGFHRIAYKDSTQGLALSDTPRCGFTAESAYRLAEGCSASIDTNDYRDYTTYFFAALSGKKRDGTPISGNPDSDANGITTLREAHLYTLEKAFSTDLSRSTIVNYLNLWQPWYLRWLPSNKALPENEYAEIFKRVAAKQEVALNEKAVSHIRLELSKTNNAIHVTLEQRAQLREQEYRLQHLLQMLIGNRWPAMLGPYTSAYQTMASNGELRHIATSLEENSDYQRLVLVQTSDDNIDNTLLQLERTATQYQKMLRLRRLSVLQDQLKRYGSDLEISQYESLLNCEESGLNND